MYRFRSTVIVNIVRGYATWIDLCDGIVALTLKQLVIFFSNVILFSNIVPYKIWYCYETGTLNEYLISAVDTDDLVLQHQGISSYSAEYTPMRFQLSMG